MSLNYRYFLKLKLNFISDQWIQAIFKKTYLNLKIVLNKQNFTNQQNIYNTVNKKIYHISKQTNKYINLSYPLFERAGQNLVLFIHDTNHLFQTFELN